MLGTAGQRHYIFDQVMDVSHKAPKNLDYQTVLPNLIYG